MKRVAPAAERNRDAVADVLARWLPRTGLMLEIASGTGEHALHFARRFPELDWQPSDPDPDARRSISAWANEGALPNLRPPLAIDAAASDWPADRADAVVCINMVHISPWAATEGLFAGAERCLAAGAPLILYGPFRRAEVPTVPSNEAFDLSLKSRDPAWGLRSVEQVRRVAEPFFDLVELAEMPANNLMLLFCKKLEPDA